MEKVLMYYLESSKNEYFAPRGGLFDKISCPHYLIEIGIYLILQILIGVSRPFFLCVIAVVLNQILIALMVHEWVQLSLLFDGKIFIYFCSI
jgi:hypothetical protein